MIVESSVNCLQEISYLTNEKYVFETAKLHDYKKATNDLSKCVTLDCDGMKKYVKENGHESIVDHVFSNTMKLQTIQSNSIIHVFLGNVKIKDCIKYKSLVELFSDKFKNHVFDKIYLHECPYFVNDFFKFFKYLIPEDVKSKIVCIKKAKS